MRAESDLKELQNSANSERWVKISLIVLALVAIIQSLKTTDPAVFDRWVLAIALYLVVTNNLVILSMPTGYLHSMMAELIGIVMLFAAMPDRPLYHTAPPVIMTIGSLTCFFIGNYSAQFILCSLKIVLDKVFK